MSDTLKSNPDQSDVDVDGNAISFPNQHQSDIDVDTDAISFQPLFEDEEGDSTLVAPQPPNRRRRTWFIVVSIVLLAALIGGGVLFYLQRTSTSQVQYRTSPVSFGNLSKA